MFCVIQEIELKKSNKSGHPKELTSNFMQMSISGIDMSHYYYRYSEERFERPIKKAFKISIHKSYREGGKPKKKQFALCTVNYYDIADGWFSLYDFCNKKIDLLSKDLEISSDAIYELVEIKLNPLIETIQNEFSQTEEFKIHEEHERITTVYAAQKIQFTEKYGCDKDKYDEIYNVFGELMNKEKLDELKNDYKARQEYEEKSSSYQEQNYSNHNEYYKGSNSSYSNNISSNHGTEDKESLKQFYRELSKKFHPDSNPDIDTSKQMQLLNQLKDEWGV